MKNLQLGDHPTDKRTAIADLKPAIRLGESALFDGMELIRNFQQANAERARRYDKK
jgi:hypothetical protein